MSIAKPHTPKDGQLPLPDFGFDFANFNYVSRQIMFRIAEFYHVSPSVFGGDASSVPLPTRATSGSAGYDFFTPVPIELAPGETVTVPTGIRARIAEGWVLFVLPKSGLGFRYRLRLDNTVGVIDSDYFGSDNEGHIIVKLTNCGDKPLSVKKHAPFCQGVFLPFGITESDATDGIRNGGFGSTAK